MPVDDIPQDIQRLWQIVDDLWESDQNLPEFESYASADFDGVYRFLKQIPSNNQTFLELGSGLGVVTIMASRLGFEAYGIEAKPELVEHSRNFAAEYGPGARFETGSFIPDDFRWNPAGGDEAVRTFIDIPDAYAELDMSLSDFDLIYAYPWPTEHDLYRNFLRQYGRRGSRFVTYDAREGMHLRTI